MAIFKEMIFFHRQNEEDVASHSYNFHRLLAIGWLLKEDDVKMLRLLCRFFREHKEGDLLSISDRIEQDFHTYIEESVFCYLYKTIPLYHWGQWGWLTHPLNRVIFEMLDTHVNSL